LGILGRSLHQAQDNFLADSINADGRHQMLAFEDSAVNEQRTDLAFFKTTLLFPCQKNCPEPITGSLG
ncbi:MAG: hypothetical protein JWP08_3658, partial [Bryobacterales bacterium]|nr:hypothetical protein [Bryobacterales bacterium]